MIEGLLEFGLGPLFILAFVSIFLVVGVVILAGGVAYLRKYALLKRTTPTDAFDVSSGQVEVEGEVVAGDETLEAPFTGEECVAYEVEVQKYRSSGGSSGGGWNTQAEAGEYVPFRVNDGTGSVGVDPTESSLSLEKNYEQEVGGGEEPPEAIAAFLESVEDVEHKMGTVEFAGIPVVTGHRQRFLERRVETGQEAFVAGTADATTAVDGATPTITGPAEGKLRNLVGDPFVVANADEDRAQRRFAFVGVGLLVLGGMFSWIPLLLFYTVLT